MTKSSGAGTRHIGVRPATNIFHGIRFAAATSRQPNLAVTINWHRLTIPDADATTLFRLLRQKVRRRWTHLRKAAGLDLGSLDDVVVHENPGGCRNTHWLVRVPNFHTLQFKDDVDRFLRKILKVDELGRALHFAPVVTPGSYAKYMVKGVAPQYADYFHVNADDQGYVLGRGRTFVSRTLGFSARKAAGWKRPRRGMKREM